MHHSSASLFHGSSFISQFSSSSNHCSGIFSLFYRIYISLVLMMSVVNLLAGKATSL
uniref:Uncharacterized protein n=1 Tax=Arundo donax TaxID=35708 RepID=A0A0A9EIF0_ARUDO